MSYIPYQERHEIDSRLAGKVTVLPTGSVALRGERRFPADELPAIVARAKQELAERLGMKLERIEIKIQF